MPSPNPANVYFEIDFESKKWVEPRVALNEQLDELTEIINLNRWEETGNEHRYDASIWVDTPLYPGEHGEFDSHAAAYLREMLRKVDGIKITRINARYHVSMGDKIPEDLLTENVINERERKIEQRLV